MSHQHKVTSTEIGMVRIYLKPSDKAAKRGRAFWSRKPLYRELVTQAKRAGVMNAIAHLDVKKNCTMKFVAVGTK